MEVIRCNFTPLFRPFRLFRRSLESNLQSSTSRQRRCTVELLSRSAALLAPEMVRNVRHFPSRGVKMVFVAMERFSFFV